MNSHTYLHLAAAAVQDKIVTLSNEVAANITTATRTVVGQLNTFAVIQFDAVTHRTSRMSPQITEWAQAFYLDLDSENLNTMRSLSSNRMREKTSQDYFPSIESSTLRMNIFLLSGSDGAEKLVGEKSLSIHDLLKSREKNVKQNFSHSPAMSDNLHEFDLDLDSTLGDLKRRIHSINNTVNNVSS